MTDTQKATIYEHPDYIDHRDLWVSYRDTLQGDPRVMRQVPYLIKHDLETKKDGAKLWQARQTRTAYTNFIEPIVGIWKNIMLSKPPNTEEIEPLMPEEEIENVDGNGASLQSFISKTVETLLTYGWVYVFSDAPPATVGETRPFLECLDPLAVVNWQREYQDPKRIGKFNFIITQYSAVRSSSATSKPRTIHFREVWARDDLGAVTKQLYTSDKPSGKEWEVEGAAIPYPFLSEIPVSAIQYGDSWVKDLTPNVIKYHNLVSSFENILYYQAYRQTWVIGQIPTAERKAVAEYVISFLPEGSTIQVVNSENPIALSEHIKLTEMNIYKIGLNILRQVSNDSSAVQGVDTIREERKNVLDLIRAELGAVETLINSTIKNYAAFKSQAEFAGEVELDRNVDLSALDVLLPMYERLRDEIGQVPTWKKQMLKRFAVEMQPGEIDIINREIDRIKTSDSSESAITRASIFGNLSGGR